jgi:hypothetical protein
LSAWLLWCRLGCLAAIWALSVAALAVFAYGFRFLMGLAGRRV